MVGQGRFKLALDRLGIVLFLGLRTCMGSHGLSGYLLIFPVGVRIIGFDCPMVIHSHTIKIQSGMIEQLNKNNVYLDNCNVMPYNRLYCILLNCHINMEVTKNISAMEYIYKYVYKLHNASMMHLASNLNYCGHNWSTISPLLNFFHCTCPILF